MMEVVMLIGSQIEALEQRGLDAELIGRLGVETSEKLGPNTIMIPYYRDGTVVGRKYRTIAGDKKFSQEPGSAQILYNLDVLADPALMDQPVIVTEGEIDAWSAIQAGYLRTVSVPGGAPSVAVGDRAAQKYEFLADLLKLPDKTTIVIATDSDDPGAALLSDLTLRLGAHR